MSLLYDLVTGAYHLGIRAAAPFNPKARQWVDGRRGLWQRLEAAAPRLEGCLWMHCASVGEFEQGRPVLEAIKKERPQLPVLLTFFSPSGYEARKDFPFATHVEYLPADTAKNARCLVEMARPKAALFIKYEFWSHHLHALQRASVPTFLVSAIFRKGQPFFKWYGGAWREMLRCYAHVFVQDDRSRDLLATIGIKDVTVSGDTRFDRVAAIVHANEELPVAKAFRDASSSPTLICGSTWPEDEQLILDTLEKLSARPRILIAPHELHAGHLRSVENSFPKPLILWSEAADAPNFQTFKPSNLRTLLIDQMGLLSRLYKYGDIAYVGGGFTDGIHSILEAAAWGKPVMFGPKHAKFAEARGLIEAGGGFEVSDGGQLATVLERLLGDPAALDAAAGTARGFVRERTGATQRVIAGIIPSLQDRR